MMLTDKHYYAFISHSTRDEKAAIWLRDKLVSYNIPASVQREHRAPKRLRPVFIYQTDLAGANLQDALQRELDDSQWLIVICSPEGAKSPYVNGEIEHFIETGRADRIIPFIVAGMPHAKNPEEECFPPALLKLAEEGTELRGINLDESVRQLGSKMGAVVNVVASMLGVRFDSMWNVYRLKQRRRIIQAAVCALVLCLAGLFAWDYTRPTYRYYADYVDRWGVPEGIIELSKEQQSHRQRMYLFEYRRIPFGEPNAYSWRVVKVSYVNSAGMPQEEMLGIRFPITQVLYDKEEGIVSQLVFSDEKGRIRLRHTLSARNGVNAAVADLVSSKQSQGVGFAAAHIADGSEEKSNIVRYVYERDANGFITRQTYHANNDYNISRSATVNADGIFGRQYERDDLGRIVKIHYLDREGNMTCLKNGIAYGILDYDSCGNRITMAYFTADGQPCINDEGYAKFSGQYDKFGNRVEWGYYGTDGQPCLTKIGCAKVTCRYDDRGNQLEQAYFGLDGRPCMCAGICAKLTYQYDNRGNMIEVVYCDTTGQPCLTYEGFAKLTCRYDERGNRIERAFYDKDGCACRSIADYAKATYKYDDRGNQIEENYFGTDGQPCLCKAGYAKIIWQYDDRGNAIDIAIFGIDGQPCLSDEGYAGIHCRYDDRGNKIEQAYFGTDGQPCLNIFGYAIDSFLYDERGNQIEQAYFGLDGQPCMNSDNYAKMTYRYDDRGNRIEMAFFGTDDKPCTISDGFSRVALDYDEYGNVIAATLYDTEGNVLN